MADTHFDALARALATGTSRRQALKGFFGAVMGLGLLAPTAGLAEAAPAATSSRADIAHTSAKLLARMPNPATLHRHNLASELLAAIEFDYQMLHAGTHAHTWNDAQLLDFQTQVKTSVQQHQALPAISGTAQMCFNNCATRFTTNVATCGTGLGGLLCEVIDVVEFDLCAVGCILISL